MYLFLLIWSHMLVNFLLLDITDSLPNNPLLKCNLCTQRLEDTHFVQVTKWWYLKSALRYWSLVPNCGTSQILLPLLGRLNQEAGSKQWSILSEWGALPPLGLQRALGLHVGGDHHHLGRGQGGHRGEEQEQMNNREQIKYCIQCWKPRNNAFDSWILFLTLCNCSRWNFFCFQCSPRIALILTFKNTIKKQQHETNSLKPLHSLHNYLFDNFKSKSYFYFYNDRTFYCLYSYYSYL